MAQQDDKQKQLLTEVMNADAKDGLYKQQTAVEWLEEELAKNLKHIIQNADSDLIESLFEQAKQMEKEQIINAWEDGKGSFSTRFPEQYYNETYGGAE